MMNLNSFSQTDTDTTQIQLTKPVARLVIKDLIQGDSFKEEIDQLELVILETNNKVSAQQELISNLNNQVSNFESIISEKDSQLEVSQELSKELEKALRKAKRRMFFYKVGTAAGGVAFLLLLAK